MSKRKHLICVISGCGNGKYLSVNPYVYTVGGDRCTRLAAQARHHNNEVSSLFVFLDYAFIKFCPKWNVNPQHIRFLPTTSKKNN